MARTLLSAAPTDRMVRSPKHEFFVRPNPFVITPFFTARILPGETLTNLFFEARSVWRGLPSSVVGFRQQHWFFYVRATDIALDAFTEMFVDPTNTDLIASTALEDANGNAATYCAAGAIDWTQRCLEKITEAYFRDEGEAWNLVADAQGLPLAQIRNSTWMDSLTAVSAMPEGPAIAGATDAGDLDRLMDAFNQLRALGLTTMDYHDWLRSQGINIPDKDEGIPRLIALFSDWQYPVNTIDPADGTPSSAMSMVFKASERKPMFFKEPGFLIGVTVTRPKILFGNQHGSLAGFATRAWDWMPDYLRAMPETSLKNFAVDTGPFGDIGASEGYFADMRDDLLHGDQFYNIGLGTTPASPTADTELYPMALPNFDYNWRYPAVADVDVLDAGHTGLFGTSRIILDGYVSLSIKGFEVDYTQRQIGVQL